VVFTLQNLEEQSGETTIDPGEKTTGLKVSPYTYGNTQSKFDLTLLGVDLGDRLSFAFEYYTKIFREETINRFSEYFKQIVSSLVADSNKKISCIDMMTDREKQQILVEFNDTTADYPGEMTIHALFEQQMERTPDHIALYGCKAGWGFEKGYITYGELNTQANRLTHELRKNCLVLDEIVAIMTGRSLEMIIGIIGILKAGCAYLPIEPDYPQERIDYMLIDSKVKVFLTSSETRVGNKSINIIDLSNLVSTPTTTFTLTVASPDRARPTSLAYIMYTSGSTGRPKGVVVNHRNVVSLVINNNYVQLTGETRILQTGAPVFDATTFEIWGALLNGGQLYVVDKEVIFDASLLGLALKKNRVNTLWLSSPLFNQLIVENSEIFSPLRYLLVGGDVLSPRSINLARHNSKKLKVINGYGPTENTTFSTTFSIEKDYNKQIPIGTPIYNSAAYIVDSSGNLVPIGVCGQLMVGGDGVSHGYLNNPEMTAEKFCYRQPGGSFCKNVKLSPLAPHKNSVLMTSKGIHRQAYNHAAKQSCSQAIPFTPLPYSPLYLTGDLARWLRDGNIEFLSRIDHQVKIRGFRVELEEIESRLLDHPLITEAVVIARKDDRQRNYLCAYIVSGKTLDNKEMKPFLAHLLPDYMIPSYFIMINKIPLNRNGKLDRKALPLPGITLGDNYAAPRNQMELKLVEIWARVLDIEKEVIGVNDNFFDLGGNSLTVIQLNSEIKMVFQMEIPVVRMFEYPDIGSMAQYLNRENKSETPDEDTFKAIDKGKNKLKNLGRKMKEVHT
jgi:amino acid adenylation domain-containing protein